MTQRFPEGSQLYMVENEFDSEMIFFFTFNSLRKSFFPIISDDFLNPCQMLVSKPSLAQNSLTTRHVKKSLLVSSGHVTCLFHLIPLY